MEYSNYSHQVTMFSGLIRIFTASFGFFIAIISLKRQRELQTFRQLIYICLTMGYWNLMQGLYYLTPETTHLPLLLSMVYSGVALSALALFYFAYVYCMPIKKINMLHIVLLSIIPILTCLFSLSYHYTSFFLTFDLSKITYNPGRDLRPVYGPWFYVHSIYSFLLMFATLALLAYKMAIAKKQVRNYVFLAFLGVSLYLLQSSISTFFVIDYFLAELGENFCHIISVLALFVLLYFDPEQSLIFYGKKDFFDGLNLPVFMFDGDDNLTASNQSAKIFLSSQGIISESDNITFAEIFCNNKFTLEESKLPSKINMADTAVSFILRRRSDNQLFSCYKKDIVDSKKRLLGFTYTLYSLSTLTEILDKLKEKAYTDELCGCFTRLYFTELTQKRIPEAHLPLALFFADLDGLKHVNDVFGHDAGDDYLQKAASLLHDCIRKSDMIFRIGGDEFILYLPNINFERAVEIKAMIKKRCRAIYVPYTFNISTGFSIMLNSSDSFDEHYELADKNMYEDKKQNKRANNC